MDWVYNVPIKFHEYNLDEMKKRLEDFDGNVLFIASKRVISTFDFDVSNFQVLDESIANPDFHLVGDILNKIKRPDLIIAVGGGSSIDLAKAISSLYEYKDCDVLDLLKNKDYLNNVNLEQVLNAPNGQQYGTLTIIRNIPLMPITCIPMRLGWLWN